MHKTITSHSSSKFTLQFDVRMHDLLQSKHHMARIRNCIVQNKPIEYWVYTILTAYISLELE